MTLEEKLARFSETLTRETERQEEKQVEDYRNTLSANFEAHKDDAYAHADLKLQHAHRSFQNDKLKLVVTMKTNIQKMLGKKAYELKRRLHKETAERIIKYKETPEYEELLKQMIHKVEAYCKDDTFELYVDRTDEKLIPMLEKLGHPVHVDEDDILGGLCAWLPTDKILLDLSFRTRLDDLIQDYRWDEEVC